MSIRSQGHTLLSWRCLRRASTTVCMLSSAHMRVASTLARPRPAVTALSLERYITPSSAHMRVENTLAGPRPAGAALSPMRYDTNGVYALKHTDACLRIRRQGHALLSRRFLRCAITLTAYMLSSTHVLVEHTLAGPSPAVAVLSLCAMSLKVCTVSSAHTRVCEYARGATPWCEVSRRRL